MDNPRNFSLGITQLDEIVEDILLKFVPATFDEQDPDWVENRSKHRNDSITMKKLTDKAASKSKKSTSKGYFEISDPTTYAAISVSGKLKRTADEVQQCVDTIAEEFGDLSTIPPQKILIKAGFASPVSPDYRLKKRKTVMFEQDSQAVMDDDTSRRDHPVLYVSGLCSEMHKNAADKGEIGESEIQHHHHGEIGVSLQSHQHKSVPSSSTQPERTSKSSLDGDEIKNYINKCMAKLVSLISKIPSEVVKALKNDENKQSQEDKIDEQQQSQEDGFKKQKSPHKEDMHDVNAAEKEAGREDDFENEDCSDLKALEDVNVTAKEDGNEVDLKKKKSTNMTDMQELEASKAKAPAKWERKNSKVLRPPYISKYGSGSKDGGDSDKEEKLKYAFDGYTINQDLLNELMIDYSQWIAVGLLKTHSAKKETDNHYRVNASGLDYKQLNFVVAHPQSKNWFYLMSKRKICLNDEPSLEAYKGKITQQISLVNEISFDVDYVQNIPQQASNSLDYGVFVCAYAEILSEGLQVHSCGFDAASQRARYASLPWHYGVKKANEGYTSDNDDPPRPRKSVIEEIYASAIVTLE
ncbi:hypothetical protein BC332_08149 [Capsicum chinense]|nr:hypothetical protein BC332_08149 [Capsicum chinense]